MVVRSEIVINRILMNLYDDYSNGNIDSLIEFSKKTLPSDGTAELFVGCVMIMFSRANGYEARYECNREILLDIVSLAKEKIGNTNLLRFYVERVNTYKRINKWFKKVFDDKNFDKRVDLIIEYLEQFKPKFIEELRKNDRKIEAYTVSSEGNIYD